MRSPRTFCAVFLLAATVLNFQPALSQGAVGYSERAEANFKRALEAYAAAEYATADVLFDRVIREPLNQRTTAAYVMRGKSLLQQGEYVEAARALRTLTSSFPTSSYLADAEFTLGLIQLRIRRYDDAMQAFLSAWSRCRKSRGKVKLQRNIGEALNRTVDQYLDLAEVKRHLQASEDRAERAFFWLKIAEKEAAHGNTAAATAALDSLMLGYPHDDYRERSAAVRAQLEQRRNVKLGVLLPLMRKSEPSALKEIGQEVYEGILLASEEYARSGADVVKVTLEVRDTERDPVVAAREAQVLTADQSIVCILGPVFSATTSAAVGLANARGIPLVTPTANANGIAAVGSFIFQANPDYATRGRAMAQYAVLTRGFRSLAVLAPIDTYAKFMAEAFIAEAQRLGAKVIAVEWYQRGMSDLKMQLMNIRRSGMMEAADPLLSFGGKLLQNDLVKLLQLGVPLKTLDSLIERSSVIPASMLLGPEARTKIDSLGVTALYAEARVDSLEYPVTGIQGLYVPISAPEEIGVVSSQIVYYNFQTQMLGSGEWNNFTELDANKRYSRGVVFESDNHPDQESPEYASFVNRFIERFRKRPGKNVLYGYDAARLVLGLIRTGWSTREALTRELTEVREYRGLRSRMGFSSSRVNSWLSVLQFTGDRIQKIDDLNVEGQSPMGQ